MHALISLFPARLLRPPSHHQCLSPACLRSTSTEIYTPAARAPAATGQRSAAGACVSSGEQWRQALTTRAVVQLLMDESIAFKAIQVATVGAPRHDATTAAVCCCCSRRRTAAAPSAAAARRLQLLGLRAQWGIAAVAIGPACCKWRRCSIWVPPTRPLCQVKGKRGVVGVGSKLVQHCQIHSHRSAGRPASQPASHELTTAPATSAAGTSSKGLTGKRWW